MRLLLCLLLLSAPSFAQEEPSGEEGELSLSSMPASDSPEAAHPRKYDGPRHRAQAFLIPMDEGARTPTSRVAQALESVLTHTPIYEVVDLGRALSVESTAEQAQHADLGRKALKDANEAAASRGWPEAAARYQTAKDEFDRGLPAVGPREYAEAVLKLGTATFMSGEDKAAKELLALAVRLDPQRRLVADEAVAPQLEQARAELSGARHCQLDVDVRPAGARVWVDGELRGQHVEAPAGKHLLRVERTGFYPYAEFIELMPRKPVKASITLAATPTATSLNQIIAGAADEAGRGGAGKNVAALAQKFSLERLLIGSVRTQEGTKVSLVLALVDAAKHKLIASKALSLVADGTDADQVEGDTQAAARKMIAQDDSPAAEDGPAASAAGAPAGGTVSPLAAGPEAAPIRRVAIPGAVPAAAAVPEEPALVSKERKVAVPVMDKPAPVPKIDAPAAKADTPAPASKEAAPKKEKGKGLQGKTGTEGWSDD